MLSVTLTLIYFSFFFTHSHRHKNSHTLTHKYPKAHWMLLFLLCVEGNIFVLLLRFQNFLKVSSLVKVSDCKKANPWTSLSRKMGQQREKTFWRNVICTKSRRLKMSEYSEALVRWTRCSRCPSMFIGGCRWVNLWPIRRPKWSCLVSMLCSSQSNTITKPTYLPCLDVSYHQGT